MWTRIARLEKPSRWTRRSHWPNSSHGMVMLPDRACRWPPWAMNRSAAPMGGGTVLTATSGRVQPWVLLDIDRMLGGERTLAGPPPRTIPSPGQICFSFERVRQYLSSVLLFRGRELIGTEEQN
jgi:hypothetical protein